MGAWGFGTFENDSAMDWVGDLTESRSLRSVQEALTRCSTATDYLEVDDCCAGLAAAEVVAAMGGKPHADLPEDLIPVITTFAKDPRLVGLAKEAVNKVVTASELQELWAESDETADWMACITDLRSRLG